MCHLLHYGIGPFFVQTFADISLVKYCHMCDLQHHATDLFLGHLCGILQNKMTYITCVIHDIKVPSFFGPLMWDFS